MHSFNRVDKTRCLPGVLVLCLLPAAIVAAGEVNRKYVRSGEHPGHFTQLKDGSVLLSYGNRLMPKGVDVRFSDDGGTTWSDPFRAVDFMGDGGYPSSVQLPDGQVLTAYYAQRIAGHDKYHMGVVIWDPATTRSR